MLSVSEWFRFKLMRGVSVKHNFDEQKTGREFDLALHRVVHAMYALELVLEKYQGDEDIICDGYPFELSFDEQVAEVGAWCRLVNEKVGK